MKKLIVALLALPVLISTSGCLKDDGCRDQTVQSESGAISAFATANGIVGTTHSTGVVYQVTVPGSGIAPTGTSQVSVKYRGKFLDGTGFDSSLVPVTIPLANTIPGWQIAMPFVQKGGTIKMIIPSSFAYGCRGRSGIPSSAVLYFEVALVDVL
jgi:FKBP-type peptidyl-prolyl cis-trans isomerase